jgi:hypothetical protein
LRRFHDRWGISESSDAGDIGGEDAGGVDGDDRAPHGEPAGIATGLGAIGHGNGNSNGEARKPENYPDRR